MKNKKLMIISSVSLVIILGASIGIGTLIGAKTKKDLDYIAFDLNDKQYKFSLEDKYTDNEKTAKKIENEFLKTSLGSDNVVFKGSQSILDASDDWNIPYMISGEKVAKEEVLNYFISTKLLKDTLTNSVFEYLVKEYSENSDAELLPVIFMFKEHPNLLPMNFLQLESDPDGKEIINGAIAALGNEDEYKNDVLRNMMIYSYLWQDSNSSAYDYIMTKEIAYSKPSMVSSVEFDASDARIGTSKGWYDDLASNSVELNKSTDWNGFWENGDKISSMIDPNSLKTKIGNDGFDAFKGIQFGQSAGTTVADDWTDISQTWDYENEEIGESKTTSGLFTHTNILSTGNIYIATPGKAPGKGAIISEDSSSHGKWINGNAQVFSYSQMYPYVFSEKIDDGTFGPTSYSLFANAGDDGTYTSATIDDEGANYIFNEWFGEDGEASKIGEIYLAEELSSFNTSLGDNASQFWHDKGYYIELSGKYSEDFSSFIPESLLK